MFIGKLSVVNETKNQIFNVKIRHSISNTVASRWQCEIPSISRGEWIPRVLVFDYNDSAWDYWWFSFTMNNKTYSIKNNFYCSIIKKDNGNVDIHIKDSKVEVYFSNSSSCSVSYL